MKYKIIIFSRLAKRGRMQFLPLGGRLGWGLFFIMLSLFSYGQKERKFIRSGNRYYHDAVENSDSAYVDSVNFVNAEIEYRKALEKKPNDFNAEFNIGTALFKQQKMEDAAVQFENILPNAPSNEDKGKAYFNLGNSLMGQQKMDECIEAYKNALRHNPKDMEARYNLEFARKMKDQQQQQDQNQDQQNQDQNKDDQNQDQKDDQNKQNQDQNDQQDKKDQQQQQTKISKQNAEQMLKALQNDERRTQEKVKKAQAAKAKNSKVEKDW